MSAEKYQIFISSTYKDLIGAREAITKAILNLYHIPIGMEMFSADNNDQWDTIKATIEDSDYYILIIGHRYGSETSEGISFTEKEYDYAKELKVPILAFIRNRDVSTTPGQRDSDSNKVKKLEDFIKKASANAMVDYWEDEKDLATHIVVALTKAFKKYSRIGWIRADKGISPQVSEEMAALSKENRELKNELQSLKDKKDVRLPKFEVFFNDQVDIIEDFVSDSELIKNSIHYLKEIETTPPELSRYIDPSSIHQYNNIINTQSLRLTDFNNKALLFERKLKTNKPYEIKIKNIGKAKANSVVAEFEFPETIIPTEKKAIEKRFKETRPSFVPQHPFDRARELRMSNGHSHGFDGIMPFTDDDLMGIASMHPDNFNIENYSLKVRFIDLLHTQSKKTSGKIYLIPLESGVFQIRVKIICEEFHEPEILVIQITIKE